MAYPHIKDKEDYAVYVKDVTEFLKGMDGPPSSGHWDCEDCEAGNYCELEASFSWQPCDCCERSLGGDRYSYIGWMKGARNAEFDDDRRWSGEICVDCVYFLTYERLDDMTMMDIEEAEQNEKV
jgi:hypothetical protein